MMILVLWVSVLIIAIWLYFRQLYSTFTKMGVKHKKPIPIVGNMAGMVLRREHRADHVNNLYKEFPDEKFIGKYEFLGKLIVLKDLELVKKVAVKDFDHFIDHRTLNENPDSYFNRSLFSLKGQEWRDMRSTLSPAFTSSKIRHMVPFMVEVGNQMVASLKQKMKEGNGKYVDVDCKDLTTRYANDVIASCAFGLKVDSHTDPNNEFYTVGKTTSTFGFRAVVTLFIATTFPKLIRTLKLDIMAEESKKFFGNLVLNTMKEREAHNIIRPDMIHLLMEARKGLLTHDEIQANDLAAGFATVDESSVGTKKVERNWSDNDLVAQAVLFLIAGFETVSSGMSFVLYELACNPDVQEKLAKEVKEQDAKNGGKFDFNSIKSMTYMDMVISELLRKWPPGIALDRVCVKDYNLGKPNAKAEKDVIIRKGMGISIPVYAFHRDPQYFPNPDKFDPERFSEENKHKLNALAYMPFGAGPRNCIGSRFALCELKVVVYQVLQHFELSPCEKTTIPAELSTENFHLKLKGGHWLRFRVRS